MPRVSRSPHYETSQRDTCVWAPGGALIWIKRNRPRPVGDEVF